MPDVLVLSGSDYNALARAALTVSDENSLRPKAKLFDGRPSMPFEFVSAGADLQITADLNLMENGGFESGITDWTDASTGTGATAESATANSGTKALTCAGGASGVGQRYVDVQVRTGWAYQLEAAIRGDATVFARVRVQCLETGDYFNGTAWTATPSDLFAEDSATYQDHSDTFTMQSYGQALGRDTVTLRVYLLCNEDGDAFFDDVYLYPAIDFLSIHGHNLTAAIAVQLRSSTDDFSAVDTLEATLTKAPRTFWGRLVAPVFRRYWRIKFSGTNTVAIRIGEAVLGQALAVQRNYDYGAELAELEDNIASETPSGERYSRAQTEFGRRVFAMRFNFRGETDDAYEEARDDIFRRSRGDLYPLVIVPDTDRPEVLHGRIDRRWSVTRTLLTAYDNNDLVLAESPFWSSAS